MKTSFRQGNAIIQKEISHIITQQFSNGCNICLSYNTIFQQRVIIGDLTLGLINNLKNVAFVFIYDDINYCFPLL